MRSFVNATLPSKAALMIRGRAIGRLRSDMRDADWTPLYLVREGRVESHADGISRKQADIAIAAH